MKFISFVNFLLFITLFSCQKGEQGPKGDPGAAGNANVKANTYAISSWVDGPSFWYADLSEPDLTQEAQDAGTVEAFLSVDSGKNWTKLPYTAVNTTNYFMNYTTSKGKVEIQWTYNGIGNGSSPNSFFGTNCQFKIVVIPPGARQANPGTYSTESLNSMYNLKN